MTNTKSRDAARPTGTVLSVFPYEMAKGDRLALAFKDGVAVRFATEGLKNDPVVNPIGCKGHTHVDSKCYDNIAKQVVLRG